MRAQQEHRDRELAQRGLPTPDLFEKYPELARMGRAMQARAARAQSWQDGVNAIVASHAAEAERTRAFREAAYERTKVRRLLS